MTVRERNLALGFAAIMMVGGAVVAISKLKAWKAAVDGADYELVMLRTEAEILLSQKDMWLRRAEWISRQQPEFTSRRDAETELLSLIQESSERHQVELVRTQPSEPVEMSGLFAPTMIIQGKGDFGAAMNWLYELQKPGSFVSIPSVSVLPNDEDTSQVNLSLAVQKWYRETEF